MAHHNKFTKTFLHKKTLRKVFSKNYFSQIFFYYKNILYIVLKTLFANDILTIEHHNKFTKSFLYKKIFKHIFLKKNFIENN